MAGFFRLGYFCGADHRVSMVSCDGGTNSAGADRTGADGITVINGVAPELGIIGVIGVRGSDGGIRKSRAMRGLSLPRPRHQSVEPLSGGDPAMSFTYQITQVVADIKPASPAPWPTRDAVVAEGRTPCHRCNL